uniref:RWD domain-containing protein n=1 Tax=Macrostomum lignano TaxID=282301 RepID=A0A1I8IBK1_9PLAT
MKLSDEAEQELAQVESVLKPLPNVKLEARLDTTLRFQLLRQEDADPALPPTRGLSRQPAGRGDPQQDAQPEAHGRPGPAGRGRGREGHRGPQVARTVAFVHNWLRDNPLCSAAEEIAEIKSRLLDKQEGDRLKLLQAESRVQLTAAKAGYRLSLQLTLPNDYPESRAEVELLSSNLPSSVSRQAVARSAEIARRCVEPPSYRGKDKKLRQQAAAWKPSPCLLPVAEFAFSFLRSCATQRCPVCDKPALATAAAATATASSVEDPADQLEF